MCSHLRVLMSDAIVTILLFGISYVTDAAQGVAKALVTPSVDGAASNQTQVVISTMGLIPSVITAMAGSLAS